MFFVHICGYLWHGILFVWLAILLRPLPEPLNTRVRTMFPHAGGFERKCSISSSCALFICWNSSVASSFVIPVFSGWCLSGWYIRENCLNLILISLSLLLLTAGQVFPMHLWLVCLFCFFFVSVVAAVIRSEFLVVTAAIGSALKWMVLVFPHPVSSVFRFYDPTVSCSLLC